MNKGNFEN